MPTWAQSAEPTHFDLNSTEKTVNASQAGTFESAVIQAGGAARTVNPTDMLTPAEHVALTQVLAGGQQTLQLSATGQAVAGTFLLNPLGQIGNLVIPTGVQAISDFSNSAIANLTGNLNNSGSLYAITSNPGQLTATFNANNIFNQSGGLITTVLPQGGLAGYGNLNSSLSLILNAVNNIVNAGTISSSANLSLTAGGTITNAGTSMAAMLSAMNNVSLNANNIVNSGTIQAMLGNINIASQMANNLVVNNMAGTLSALNGNINIRDGTFLGKYDLSLLGGDFIAQQLNVFSGNGIALINVGKLSGLVNVQAGDLHISSATDNLHLGDILLTGDPTFYNTAGDVTISGNLGTVGTPLTVLAVVASGNITTTAGAGSITTQNASGSGGAITMIAGAKFTSSGSSSGTSDTTSTLTITGASETGGKIDLATGNAITSLTSASTGGSGSGGAIQLLAFAGTGSGSGTITLPTAVTITASGNGAGSNGNITILAGANSGNAISIGNVTSSGGATGTGNITIENAQPTLTTTSVIINPGGAIGAGGFTPGVNTAASLSALNLLSGGGTITVAAGTNAVLGSVTSSATASGAGGVIDISTSSSTTFNIGGGGANGTTGAIIANALTAGQGGTISITNNGIGGITHNTSANLSNTSAGNGRGGALILDAVGTGPGGTLQLGTGATAVTISANAAGSGTVGTAPANNIRLIGSTLAFSTNGLTLNATGGTTGAGGNIFVQATGGAITAGTATTLKTNAVGGSTSGAGGTISITSSGALAVTTGANFTAAPTNGAGPTYNLTSTGSTITVTGALSASAVGAAGGTGGTIDVEAFSTAGFSSTVSASALGSTGGSGGTIVIATNSGTTFNVGGSSTQGTSGAITANAVTGGQGGSITITNNGTGGITHNTSANLSVTAAGNGRGGSITLDAVGFGSGGPLQLGTGGTAVTIAASALGSGSVGTAPTNNIKLLGTTLAFSSNGLTLTSNGGTTGAGGKISVQTLTGAITAGTSTTLITNAVGGSTSGAGGTISLIAGGALAVTTGASFTAAPTNGAGANFSLTSTTSSVTVTGAFSASAVGSAGGAGGSITVSAATNAGFSSTVSASALGSTGGAGGTISINTTSATTFNIGGSSSQGTSGAITANAVTGGQGGIISITNNGTGGITHNTTANLSVTAIGNGRGGSISLDAVGTGVGGSLQIGTGGTQVTISANAVGSGSLGTAPANNIMLKGTTLSFSTNGLTLSATGGTTGAGGNISVQTMTGAITAGTSSTLKPLATGGSTSGAGGTISINAYGTLAVTTGANFNAAPINGQGATYSLASQTSSVTVTGALSASAVGAAGGAGGNISVSAETNAGFSSTVSANALGSTGGKGGTITINSNSSSAFIIGGSATQGTSGAITANAVSSGQGGVISIANNGTGGITHNTTANLSVTAAGNGLGGSITLDAIGNGVSGTLTLGTGATAVTLTANAVGSGTVGVGVSHNILLKGTTLLFSSNGLTLNATGGTTGAGGEITVQTSAGAITAGTATTLIVNAAGGSTSGAGGSVTLNAGGALTVTTGASFNAGPTNGAGASYSLSGASVVVTGALNANAAGAAGGIGGSIIVNSLTTAGFSSTLSANAAGSTGGAGGIINITTNNGASFSIGGSSSQGTSGAISANAATGGQGGTISITNNGTGGITHNTSANLSVTAAGNGRGGSIILDAIGSGTGGLLQIGTGATAVTISANAAGSGSVGTAPDNNISLKGSTLSISNNGLTLNATGGTTGTGGKISVQAVEDSLEAGTATSLILNARGGSTSGAGGTITLISGLRLAVTPGSNFTTTPTSGSGGTYNLTSTGSSIVIKGGSLSANAVTSGAGGNVTISAAQTSGNGSLSFDTINSTITANGAGAGSGGIISVTTNSPGTFNIGGALVNNNGTGATISAAAGATSGNGGSITIINTGIGGITVPDNNISVAASAAGGSGGTIILNATTGPISGPLIVTRGISLSASATTPGSPSAFNGGQITLSSSTITWIGSSSQGLTLTADGKSNGAGGQISITTEDELTSLSVDSGASDIAISARGGSLSGAGGSLSLSAGKNITVNLGSALTLDQTSGSGAQFSFIAGTNALASSGNVSIKNGSLFASAVGSGTGGTVTIIAGQNNSTGGIVSFDTSTSTVLANGAGVGAGGIISITTNSATAFNIGGASINTNGTGAALSANATGTTGAGGSVSIYNNGSGGITMLNNNVSVSAAAGTGGTINFDATGGATDGVLTLAAGTTLSASAAGSSANGGAVTLKGSSISFSGGTSPGLTINANAVGAGNGGQVEISTTGTTSDIAIGTSSTAITVNARGGSVQSAAGNGGSLTVSAGRDLSVTLSALSIGLKGLNGNGSTLNLTAGATAASGNLLVTGTINVNGIGVGNGGIVSLTSKSATSFNVGSAGANGTTGAISAAAGTSGSGGQISITNNNGGITLNNGITKTVTATGTGNSSGGSISLLSSALTISGGTYTLNVDGNAQGNGGSINVATTGSSSNIVVGSSSGNLIISAKGGYAGGNGGIVELSAGNDLTVAVGSISYNPQATHGDGATLSFTAGAAASPSSGNLQITGGNLTANGVGLGDGGIIELISRSSTAFSVGSSTANSINGLVTANAGSNGNGGSITVSNLGTGGFTHITLSPFSVSPSGNGDGGKIFIDMPTGPYNASFSGSASYVLRGSGSGNGGELLIRATSVIVGGGASFGSLDVSGATTAGTGNGGKITIDFTGATTDLNFGASVSMLANAGSIRGNGGTIIVFARDINLTTSVVGLAPSTNGNGGTITLTASRNIAISGNLTLNGVGRGDGGKITMTSNSTTAFSIGGGGVNGTSGSVTANAGASSGRGGEISITNLGTGGISVPNGASLDANASASGGHGGKITLDASGGIMTIRNSQTTFSVNAGGASGAFNGGELRLTAQTYAFTGGGSPGIDLFADAVGTGNGGKVFVTALATTGAITVGTAGGQFEIFARGGSTGSSAGNGGQVTLTAGENLTVNISGLSAAPRGTGTGATFDFSAGNNAGAANGTITISGGSLAANANTSGKGGTITLEAGLVNGNGELNFSTASSGVQANGVGAAAGGTITISTAATEVFNIGGAASATANGTRGAVTTNAGATSGNGGTISITNSNGAMSLSGLASLSAASSAGAAGGNGGLITLSATGALTLVSGTISLSATGTSGTTGGTFIAHGSTIATGGALTINANGNQSASGVGRGGVISITATDTTGDLTVNSSNLVLNATGGTAGGGGGSITLSAGRALTVVSSSLNVNPLAGNNNGGSISLTSATATVAGANLQVSGSLTANGLGNGDGGSISLTYNDPTNPFVIGGTVTNSGVSGSLTVDAPGSGTGGTILVTNLGSAQINISLTGTMSATAPIGGTIGELNFNAPGQVVQVIGTAGAGNLIGIVNANGSSVTIEPNAPGVTFQTGTITSTGNVTLRANGAGSSIVVSSESVISSSAGDVLIETPTLNNNGNITTSKASGSVTVQGTGALTLTGSGHLTANGSGTPTILVQAQGANALNMNSAWIFDAGATGTVTFRSQNNSGSISVAADAWQLVTGGSSLIVSTPLLILANNSLIHSDKATGTGITINNGTATTALTIRSPSSNSTTIGTDGSNIAFAPANNQALIFDKSGGTATTIFLNTLGVGNVTSTTTGATTINPLVTLSSDTNVQMNVNGGNILTVDGLLTSTKSAGSITMQSTSGLTMAGSGDITFSGGGSGSINVSASGANALAFTSNLTYDPTATGTVNFNSQSANGSVTLAANTTQTINSGADLTVSTSLFRFLGANATIDATAGASDITVNSGTAGNNLTVESPSGITSAGLNTAGGTIHFAPTSTGTLTFSKSSSTATTLQLVTGSTGLVKTTTTANTTVDPLVTVAADGDVEMNVNGGNIMTANGTITTSKTGANLTIQSTASLTLAGNGTLSTTGSGAETITVQAQGANSLTISGSLNYNADSQDYVRLQSTAAGGSVIVGSGTTQTGTGGLYMQVIATQITFSGAATLSNSSGYLDLTGDQRATNITLTNNTTVNVNLGSATAFIGSYAAQNLVISKTAGAQSATLQINNDVQTFSNGANTTIDLNVRLSSSGDLTVNVDGGILTTNGTITTSKVGGTLTLGSFDANTTLAGIPQGITATGGGGSTIIVQAGPAGAGHTLTFNSSHSFDAGSDGTVNLFGTNLTTSNLSTMTVSGGTLAYFGSNVSLGGASTISGVSGISFIASGGSNSLNLTMVDSASATMTTSSGQIEFLGQSITFAKSVGGGTTILNLNNAPVYIQSVNGNTSINNAVTLQATGDITLQANGGVTLNLNGTIKSTKNGGTIDISGTSGLTIGGTTTGTIQVSGAGANSISLFGFDSGLTVNNSIILDAGASGSAIIGAACCNMTMAANKTITFASQTSGRVQATNLLLSGNNTITGTKTTGTALTVFSPNPNPFTLNLQANTSSTFATGGGAIEIFSPKNVTIGINGGGPTDTATLNLTGGPATITSNQGTTVISPRVTINSQYDLTFNVNQISVGSDGEIHTSLGSITLVAATGTILIGNNVTMYANEGNLTIQNTDTSGGAIDIASGADLTGFTLGAPGLGYVNIVIGPIPSMPVVGSVPANVTLNQTGGGVIYFGANSINAAAPNNTINAKGRDVIFDTGGLGPSAITLGGNVTITADPPEATSAVAGAGVNSFTFANFNSLNAVDTTASQRVSGITTTVIPFDTSPSSSVDEQVSDDTINNMVTQAMEQAGILDEHKRDHEKDNQTPYEPISYSPGIARKKLIPASSAAGLYTLETESALIKCTRGAKVAVKEPGVIHLKSGEALIVTSKDNQRIIVGRWQVNVGSSAAVVVSYENNILKVTDVYDKGAHAVSVITSGGPIALGSGQEVIIAGDDQTISGSMKQDGLGRRHTKSHVLPSSNCLAHSEISLVSLLENNTTVNQLVLSRDPDDRALANRMLKMAACLMMATTKHGPYQSKPQD